MTVTFINSNGDSLKVEMPETDYDDAVYAARQKHCLSERDWLACAEQDGT